MKQKPYLLFLSLISFSAFFSGQTIAQTSPQDCSNLVGCDRKFCEIEQQISTAQKADNQRKVDGLTIALKKAKKYCTDESLKQDLAAKIKELEDDISDDKDDLKQAEAYNKPDKIDKYQQRIFDKTAELEQLNAELSSLK